MPYREAELPKNERRALRAARAVRDRVRTLKLSVARGKPSVTRGRRTIVEICTETTWHGD
jgi:hypothetical protein